LGTAWHTTSSLTFLIISMHALR